MTAPEGGPATAGPAPVDRAALLDLAVRAALAGARELVARSGRATGVRLKSSATDPVSDADRASELAITTVIGRERPDDGLLGEEGASRAPVSGLTWVIDPLDGTVNYLYGLPHATVSVACESAGTGSGGQPLVAVVHDPARDETFTAVHGGGARLNGRPLTVNRPGGLDHALISTGFAYRAASRARQARTLRRLLPRVRDVRSHGSAALELCWVAAGRCDGYYEDELAPWDWAAGALIVREAGGAVSPLGSGVVAASPAVHDALLGLVP